MERRRRPTSFRSVLLRYLCLCGGGCALILVIWWVIFMQLIPGRVVKIPSTDVQGRPQKVPHISWDPLNPAGGRTDFAGTVLAGVTPGEECYFIHSYEAKPADEADRLADTVYGGRAICAAAAHGSVVGCQFHPEKSGKVGLKIIEEYLKRAEKCEKSI